MVDKRERKKRQGETQRDTGRLVFVDMYTWSNRNEKIGPPNWSQIFVRQTKVTNQKHAEPEKILTSPASKGVYEGVKGNRGRTQEFMYTTIVYKITINVKQQKCVNISFKRSQKHKTSIE